MPVQGTRDKLLAGTRLAGDQNRHRGLREPADGAEDLLHRRSLTEHLGRFADRRRGARARRGLGASATDQGDGMIDVERLGQILERPALKRRNGAVEVGVRSHDNHRDLRETFPDVAQEGQPGFAGHANVGDQHLRLTLLQCLEYLVG
jgi:hypothetical protein